MLRRFRNRAEGGQLLAKKLRAYAHDPDAVVLGLPRGGVVVAYQIATELDLPLDVLVVRKLGVPGQEELAMGAIALGGVRVLHDEVVAALGIDEAGIEETAAREQIELERRERFYRGNRPPPDLNGKKVILVDDGIATGSTMRAAIAVVRKQRPARVAAAVPTAARSTCEGLSRETDEVVSVLQPAIFYAIGEWYIDFTQTSDDEVAGLLARAVKRDFARTKA